MTTILIIEDNEMNWDMLSRRLIKRGFEVSLAVDGEEGVEEASRQQPDLILMDITLPGIDGYEATRRLKAGPLTAHIPVVALTSRAMSGDRERALAAGCDAYDTKPVDLKRLLNVIDEVVNRPRGDD